jgi:hypothetical protein
MNEREEQESDEPDFFKKGGRLYAISRLPAEEAEEERKIGSSEPIWKTSAMTDNLF